MACKFCYLEETASNVVVSRGNPRARFMIIGEAPGAMEDKQGKPFVGRSGQLLDQMLEKTGFEVDKDVYICNVVKTRPPKNRRPTKKEIRACLPWLYKQVELVDPFVIALAGSTAFESLFAKKLPITSIRGTWLEWQGRLVMPLFHPAYLLRKPSEIHQSPKSLTKNDLFLIYNKLKTFESASSMSYLSPDLGLTKS